MLSVLLPALLLNLFSLFNLLGIKKELLINQIVFIVIGLAFFFISKKTRIFFFRSNSKFFYWFFIFLLAVTFIIGTEVRGSKRWIDFYFFNFQSSEFFKVFFTIFIADYFSRLRRELDDPKVFFKSIGYVLLPASLIAMQPDLGNALVYVVIYGSILLFSQTPKKYVLAIALLCFVALPTSWLILQDYQKERIVSFMNPELSQRSTSYNMIQAIITAGSGQFLGKGLGYGTQSRLFFLPENHTDFAYSSLVEQFGFIGGLIVLGIFFYIIIFLMKKIQMLSAIKDDEHIFLLYFSIGFFSFFSFQVLINIGMNLGMFPIVGITLPFISYGGSSLVSLFFALGLFL